MRTLIVGSRSVPSGLKTQGQEIYSFSFPSSLNQGWRLWVLDIQGPIVLDG